MHARFGIMLLGLAVVAMCQFGGCAALFIPPVDLDLAETEMAEFEVQAGVPQQKTGSFTFDTGGYTIGSGSLRINAEAISVTPASAEGSKTNVILQDGAVSLDDLLQADTCLEACDLAGVGAQPCSDVCQQGLIIMFIIVAAVDDTDCLNGDEYEVRVTLDQNVQVAEVDVSPNTFVGNTKDLLNSGEFRVCIEVLAGFDATIGLSALTLSVGP